MNGSKKTGIEKSNNKSSKMKREKKELSIIENLIWNSMGSFTYLICQWLLTLIIVRGFNDLEGAGYFALAISITNIFFNLACFNVRPYLVSDLTNYYKAEEYSAFRIVTCVFSFVLCCVYTGLFKYSSEQISCVILYMIFKLGEAGVDLLHGFEQRKSRMDIGGISLFARGILSLVSFIIGMKLTGNINVGIVLMTICTWGFIFIYDMPQAKKFEKYVPKIEWKRLRDIFLEFLPLTIGGVLSSLGPNLPKQMLESVHGSESLGIYSTVATPAVFVQVAATYIFNPMLTEFARLYYLGEEKKFAKMIMKITLFLFGLSIISLIGAKILGKWGLTLLYGEVIGQYEELFLPVIVFTCLNALVWFLWNILIILREMKVLLIINLIGVVVCGLIMIPMIHQFGMQGVNYTLIVYTFTLLLLKIIVIAYDLKYKFREIVNESEEK